MKLEDLINYQKTVTPEQIVQEFKALGVEFEESIPEYLINDPRIIGYPDVEMQNQIYNWVIDDIRNESSIKDYGCGRGDFCGHIIQCGYDIGYIGYDINPNIINIAKKKYSGCKFFVEDFLNVTEISDYTICIGTLNDNYGHDKWEYFNRTLNNALSNTKVAIIFVLSRNFDGNSNFLDYPFEELFQNLNKDLRFEIDYTKFEDIYKLTVHIGGYN